MEETYYKDTKFSKTQTDSTPQADLLFEWPSSHEPQNQVKVDDLPPPKKSSSWRIPNLLKKWPFHTETVEEMQKRVDEELRIFNEEIQASIALKKVTTAAEIKNIKRESARRIVQTEDNSKQEAFNFVMKYSTLEEIKRYNDAQGSRDYAEITRNDVIKRSRESTKI
ncbi:uncharacterized protein LOC110859677 isoform X2 [Folsomia candida]|uniref:uncharacterized protein LOC110859677 isoform X2 n=1 Tax=Folsomia candida TaxID=158441 RepID=UPI0016051194|nr:uncharacterized protein LOC110859677 isoform X2 [Folsomia candida]